MGKSMTTWVSVVMVLGLSSAAHAQSLAKKKGLEEATKQAEREVGNAKEQCGTNLKVAFDWDTFDGSFDATNTPASAAGNTCGMLFREIFAVCGNKDGKEAVAKNLKEVRCAYDKTANRIKLELKDGVLHANLSYAMENFQKDTKDYLMNHL
jgi:hypothetical protein